MKVSSPKRDMRQRQLLDAALRVFSRDGFDGASVASIADEAGVAKGSVYLYFDSKEALAGDLVRDVFTNNDEEEQPSLQTKPLENAILFCTRQEARIQSLGEFAGIVLHMWGHAGKSDNDLIARGIRQISRESLFLIETLLERARELGDLPAATDCHATARAFLALCYGLIQQRVTFERNLAAPQVRCEDALRIYLRGLGAKV
jgi:TetR/AcrR family fatty acid metabolism transcriptional regulator